MSFWVNLIGLVLFLPLAVPLALTFDWSAVPGDVWFLLLVYAVSAGVVSFVLWYAGQARVPVSVAGLFTGFAPLTTAALAIGVEPDGASGHHQHRLFQVLLEGLQELRAGRAVDQVQVTPAVALRPPDHFASACNRTPVRHATAILVRFDVRLSRLLENPPRFSCGSIRRDKLQLLVAALP